MIRLTSQYMRGAAADRWAREEEEERERLIAPVVDVIALLADERHRERKRIEAEQMDRESRIRAEHRQQQFRKRIRRIVEG